MVLNKYKVKTNLIFICGALLFLLGGCKVFDSQKEIMPKEEFRGFWVATVANIDWPKSPEDNVDKKKQDYLEILDFYQDLNFNAAIVQIRTAGDAFYPTEKAPWSKYLSGKQGTVNEDEIDLLKWMIEETHKRGFEFHAWLNPYRATVNADTTELSENHDYFKHPEWMIKYGTKYYYNPGLPEVKSHMMEIIEEVLVNYDIDALHFDDYFYPYQIAGEEFEDSDSYQLYKTGEQSIEDWRRNNVNELIQEIHTRTKERKPWVQFGISPFGVWRNQRDDIKGSATQAGQTNYDNLFADPLKWIEEGWIDYILPQIYWSLDFPVASHKTIMQWWMNHSGNAHLYIGNGPYKIKSNSDKAWNKKREIPLQIEEARKYNKVQGNVYFSAKSLMYPKNEKLVDLLKKRYYQYPALTPSLPGRNHLPASPAIAKVEKLRDELSIQLKVSDTESLRYLVLYAAPEGKQVQIKNPAHIIGKFWIKDLEQIEGIINLKIKSSLLNNQKIGAITVLDRFYVESMPEVFLLK
jgi:uncharacterized lipoprotein YddW (UPF0748 family)